MVNLLAAEAEPRRPSVVQIGDKEIDVGPGATAATARKLHDPNVTFEEYLYHARIARSNEHHDRPNPDYVLFGMKIKSNSRGHETLGEQLAQVMGGTVAVPAIEQSKAEGETAAPEGIDEKAKEGSSGSRPSRLAQYGVTEDEITLASRAVRTAGWSAIFFLITTDILGPFVVPQAFAYMGYGPAVVLYTIFGFLAAYGGFLLWKMFLGLDSDQYPLRTYGDISFRIFGSWARHATSFLQFLQLLLNVAIIIIQNGGSLEEIIVGSGHPAVCYIIMCFVWAIAGALFGQIRTLKSIGWIGNLSVWLNVFTIFMVIGVASHTEPLYDVAANQNGPLLGFDVNSPHVVQTYGGAPPGTDFYVQVNGLQLSVFAFGGATIFIELMAEMRRPWDFWKGMVTAQLFIYFFYLLFGLLLYSFQGQYSINPAYQSISPYAWQTVGNALQLVTSFIAALLYGNVGLKVAYNALLRDVFNFPELTTRKGKFMWGGLIPIFWAVAFVIGGAIPQIGNLTAFVGALTIMQFSYTFPPLLFVGYLVKRDAMLPGDGFNPTTGETIRQDSGFKRHWRGFKKHLFLNSWHVFFFLGSLVTAALGLYASIEGMIAAYAQGSQSSFSCNSIYG